MKDSKDVTRKIKEVTIKQVKKETQEFVENGIGRSKYEERIN